MRLKKQIRVGQNKQKGKSLRKGKHSFHFSCLKPAHYLIVTALAVSCGHRKEQKRTQLHKLENILR